MNILAVGAHPDDLEIYCYGTLAKLAREGHSVFMCSAANGNMGHKTIKPKELAEIRRAEAIRGAELIGATHLELDIGDLKINASDETQQEKMVEICMALALINNRLVFYASFASSCPNYVTGGPCFDPVVPIYYMETAAGIGFVPEEYVDISEYLEQKVEAILCHKSQAQWLDQHDGFNMEEYVRVCARYRGIQSGTLYAEGFRKCNVWPRVQTKRNLP